jgi:hypothetical protein
VTETGGAASVDLRALAGQEIHRRPACRRGVATQKSDETGGSISYFGFSAGFVGSAFGCSASSLSICALKAENGCAPVRRATVFTFVLFGSV